MKKFIICYLDDKLVKKSTDIYSYTHSSARIEFINKFSGKYNAILNII